MIFTLIFAVFLYDFTFAYQILSKWKYFRRSYDITSIFKVNGRTAANLLPASALVTALV